MVSSLPASKSEASTTFACVKSTSRDQVAWVRFPFFVVTVVVTVDVDEMRYRFPERLKTRACESQSWWFAFERLDVYQRAIELLVVVAQII